MTTDHTPAAGALDAATDHTPAAGAASSDPPPAKPRPPRVLIAPPHSLRHRRKLLSSIGDGDIGSGTMSMTASSSSAPPLPPPPASPLQPPPASPLQPPPASPPLRTKLPPRFAVPVEETPAVVQPRTHLSLLRSSNVLLPPIRPGSMASFRRRTLENMPGSSHGTEAGQQVNPSHSEAAGENISERRFSINLAHLAYSGSILFGVSADASQYVPNFNLAWRVLFILTLAVLTIGVGGGLMANGVAVPYIAAMGSFFARMSTCMSTFMILLTLSFHLGTYGYIAGLIFGIMAFCFLVYIWIKGSPEAERKWRLIWRWITRCGRQEQLPP